MPRVNDQFEWAATFQDGTILREYEDDGTERGFADLPRDGLTAVACIPQQPGYPSFAVAIADASVRPIFTRTRAHPIDVATGQPTGEPFVAATVLGFQKTVQGRNVKALLYALPDGRLVLSDREAF